VLASKEFLEAPCQKDRKLLREPESKARNSRKETARRGRMEKGNEQEGKTKEKT
jgi:hypothetical protein